MDCGATNPDTIALFKRTLLLLILSSFGALVRWWFVALVLWCVSALSIIRCHICQMTGIEYHWSKSDFATILERKPKTWECNKKYNIYEFVINLGSGNGERTNLFTADTEKKNCPTPKTIFFHPSFFIFLLETVWCLLQSTIKGFQLLVFRRE